MPCRLAGLFLVVKSLREADAAVLERLYSALGSTFLLRLLIPLRDPRLVGTVQHTDVAGDAQAGA